MRTIGQQETLGVLDSDPNRLANECPQLHTLSRLALSSARCGHNEIFSRSGYPFNR